ADFGAQVLKVEGPDGDRMGHHPGHLMWNRGKARVSLDIAAPKDRTRIHALIAGADVAIFDAGPGVLEPLGLDGASLTAQHPRLVHVWTPPYGTSGPWSGLPPHHATLTGLTGTAFRQGSYGNQPVWHVAPIVHYGQATMAAGAAGAALLQRGKTGLGQAVTVSGLHAMSEISGPISLIDVPGMTLHPLGGSPGYRLYRCGDGEWLFLGTLFPHFFQRAIDALGLARLREIPPDAIDIGGLIQHVFGQKPRDEWMALLRAHDVPAAPVEERARWLKSEPIGANAMRVELAHPTLGPVEMPGVALKLRETPGAVTGLMREAREDDLAAFAAQEPATAPSAQPGPAPLAGIKVLDLGTVIAGAYASAILGNFGADVIKIESAEGDPFRPYGVGFMNYNRGKRGLGLDLKSPEGRATFLQMARTADVVIDNYRLGVRERLGIDYATLKAVNPRIISLSINAYGSTGAEASLPGFDPLLQARSGLMSAQGGRGQEPVFHAIPVNDVATAAMASFGVIAALNAREITGEGQNIETCLAAQSAMFQSGELTTHAGAPEAPMGCRDCLGFAALDRYYPCADGWLVIACTTPKHFDALAGVIGDPDWPARFPDPLGEARDGELAQAIEAALCGRRRDEAAGALFAAGVPAAPVYRGEEAVRQEWLWEDGFYELRSHALWGEMVTSGAYADFSRGKSGFATLHPELGEHSVEVLLDFGVDIDRIRELAKAGVIFRS
ncbi:MAG TPA: CoA transferase, partial [Caulobacteraceae bacterium]|nr:CoA transferase [Caulobacteraceae bacterium]